MGGVMMDKETREMFGLVLDNLEGIEKARRHGKRQESMEKAR